MASWTAFSAATLGSVSLLLATPQMDPEGVTEVSEFIQMEIHHDMMMAGSEVSVSIDDGIATLSGSATSIAQAERAAAKAFTSPEILTVVNRIEIATRNESSLASGARNLLATQKVIDASRIKLNAEGSHIVLNGEVGSLDEAELAREIVSETPGVTAVKNNLSVDFLSIRSDNQIAAQLEYSVNDDPLFTGLDITPKVNGGVVVWQGQVGSRGEFDRLIRRSYVTGVIEVDAKDVTVNGDLAMEAVEDKNYSPSQSMEALNAAISHDPALKNENISADMNQGRITLTGSVASIANSDTAELTARCIPGVLAVSNKLSVEPGSDLATNHTDFKAASPQLVKPDGR